MNFIINSAGAIINLQENISHLLPFEHASKNKITIQTFIAGLPSIFPLNNVATTQEFKNLQLIKNVGLFNTHKNEVYVNLKIQKLELNTTAFNYLCSLEFSEKATDKINSSSKTKDELSYKASNRSLIKLIEGSVFTLTKAGIVSSIIQDGELGVLNKNNIQEGINLFDAVDKNNAIKIKFDINSVKEINSFINIQYKFRDRNKELILDGKISKIEKDEYLIYIKDVTQIKKLEKEKEEFAKFPIDNPNPVFRLTITGKILFANVAANEFTRKIGKTNNSIYNEDIKAISKASIYDGVVRSIKIKINKEFFFLTVSPNQENKYVNVYALNITQQEVFHEKLKQKSIDLNSILNSSEESIFLINKNQDLVYYNQKTVELFNEFGIKQLNTWTKIITYLPSEYQNEFIEKATKCLSSSEIIKSEITLNLKIFSITYFPTIDKIHNKVIGICIQIKDITESTKIKDEILKQKLFYEDILNNLPTDIAVLDSKMKYLFINPKAISNVEVRNYMIGKDDFEYAALKNIKTDFAARRKALFTEVATTGKPITFDDIHTDLNGKDVVILRKYFPVYKNGEIEMMLGYGLDISAIRESENETKRSEKELQIANNKLQKNYAQLMQYSYIVSHNLRAPIANLIGLAGCFHDSKDNYNQTIINHIKESSQRIDEILRDLNVILSIKEEINSSKIIIDLERITNETLNDLKKDITLSEAIITTDFSQIKIINSVHSFIQSIFYNLISNAIKYRSIDRTCNIHIKTIKEEGNLIIKFADNGIGIDLVKHGTKIFGIYKRFHKNVASGTGVGLHLIKEQIETLGGTISVESTPGIGTEFTITLNINRNEQNSIN